MKNSMLVNVNVRCPDSMRKFCVVLPVPDKTAPLSSMLGSLNRHVEASLNDPSQNLPEGLQLKVEDACTRLAFQGHELYLGSGGSHRPAAQLDYYLPTTNSLATGFTACMTADEAREEIHPGSANWMQGPFVYVRTLNGGTLHVYAAESSTTVEDLKYIIQERAGGPTA